MKPDFDVIIVGGGLAGLTAAIVLAGAGNSVLLIEKKSYPYHKVCGEYVSNEVLGYLQSLGFDPLAHGAARISRLRISTPKGHNMYAPLSLGGFGLSRYKMDSELCRLAQQKGAQVLTETRVADIFQEENLFKIMTATGNMYTSKLVIGSWGKREVLDKKLERPFMAQHTGYMAVKYHLRTDYPVDEIGLDNYPGGYCGLSKIEDDKYCCCHFYRRDERYQYKTIREFEEAVVFTNPVLKTLFANAEFVFNAPVVINEISFAPKAPVERGIFMCGDSAGLITPLCGNGMSMAIGGAKLLTELILQSKMLDEVSITNELRERVAHAYTAAWQHQFRSRLFWGRTIQRFFGNPVITGMTLRTIHAISPLERALINATHGEPLI